jgi:hypothetical protein
LFSPNPHATHSFAVINVIPHTPMYIIADDQLVRNRFTYVSGEHEKISKRA